MVKIFVYRVKCGMTLDEVPIKWRDAVRVELEKEDQYGG